MHQDATSRKYVSKRASYRESLSHTRKVVEMFKWTPEAIEPEKTDADWALLSGIQGKDVKLIK
jgi:hypothetical protein